jgi:PTS system nitrogen regulatory IIA component
MQIADLIKPDQIFLGLEAERKADLLADLAKRASGLTGVSPDAILQPLTNRESFGSTGIGRGIAIPHASIPALKRPVGLFARLEEPIDFEAIDGEPVDLVFLLLTPTAPRNQNVASLAAISRRLRDPAVLQQLRTDASPQKVYKALVS